MKEFIYIAWVFMMILLFIAGTLRTDYAQCAIAALNMVIIAITYKEK